MADEALDRDLDQMTGSPALVKQIKQIKQIKQSLHRLADGAGGPRLAEVARDVLDGRMALRDLGKSAAYGDYFTDAIAGFQRWQAGLTPEQREQYLNEARSHLNDGA